MAWEWLEKDKLDANLRLLRTESPTESDTPHPKQLTLGCTLSAINRLLSPYDASSDRVLSLQKVLEGQLATGAGKLAADGMWHADYNSLVATTNKGMSTGQVHLEYARSLLERHTTLRLVDNKEADILNKVCVLIT